MEIYKIFSFLVPPGKHKDIDISIPGADLPLNGRLFKMLADVYLRSDKECNIPILCSPAIDGEQQNDFRDELIMLLKQKSITTATRLAYRLYSVTTNKSGLGLLFIIMGQDDLKQKIVISRFPAEQGVTAEESSDKLTVTYIERVFMKNSHFYKSVLYTGSSFDADFWDGSAVDKQIAPGGIKELSNYWIEGFLLSEFKTTPKEGTRRLANALKIATENTDDINIKREIVSAALLARNLKDEVISINNFCNNFSLSESTKNLIVKQIPHPELLNSNFIFDTEEFQSIVRFKAIELNNGATLIAHADKFDECFNSKLIDAKASKYHFETEGSIINTEIRKKA